MRRGVGLVGLGPRCHLLFYGLPQTLASLTMWIKKSKNPLSAVHLGRKPLRWGIWLRLLDEHRQWLVGYKARPA